VSEQFAEGFCKMLENRDCLVLNTATQESDEEPGDASVTSYSDTKRRVDPMIDMKKLKSKIKSNQIDIEYLNQCLKSDNAYVMEGQDDEM
jgi:hypothetical protein